MIKASVLQKLIKLATVKLNEKIQEKREQDTLISSLESSLTAIHHELNQEKALTEANIQLSSIFMQYLMRAKHNINTLQERLDGEYSKRDNIQQELRELRAELGKYESLEQTILQEHKLQETKEELKQIDEFNILNYKEGQ